METEEALAKYESELRPTYGLLATRVQDLLTSILRANNITPHSITSREKGPQSLRRKITGEGKTYLNPLEEVTDLAAARIITYFPSDVDRIVPIIEREFSIDPENSIDRRKTADPSTFGYASVHLVVALSESRLKLPEYGLFKGMKCEVQVRTILQHAWAEIEHDIVYKASEDIPFELRRKFASLAGLLEVADREFESLRHDEIKVREKIKGTVKMENLDIPVDLDSLSVYLEKFHRERVFRPRSMSALIRMFLTNKVETLAQLKSVLTEASLSRADGEIEKLTAGRCPESKTCLLRYFLAAGRHFGMSDRDIGELAHCPALLHPEAFREGRPFPVALRKGKVVVPKEQDVDPSSRTTKSS